MLTLNDGRAELWQWDTGRTLSVDADCSQVHFSNKVFGRSIDVDVVDGVSIIPDILLQTDKELNVWAFVGTAENGYTKISKTFKVNRRNKPADYVFTPTDQITLQTIQRQIGDLDGLTTEAKDTLVAAINEAARTGGGGSTVELDTTLTQSGKAADAKAVGDALACKQNTISDLEAIRSGAALGATALQSVPSTYRTASEQDTIDDGKVDKVTGKGLSSNDYTDAAKAKVDALAPVATSGSYNDLTNKPTIPTALPNPNALTFSGAVTGSYDGSEALTVEISSGGGGGSSAFMIDTTTEEEVSSMSWTLPAKWKKILILNIHITVPSQDTDMSLYAKFGDANNSYKGIGTLKAAAVNGVDVYLMKMNETYMGLGQSIVQTYPSNARPAIPSTSITPSADSDQMMLYSNTSGINFPTGTIFKIWGVYAP